MTIQKCLTISLITAILWLGAVLYTNGQEVRFRVLADPLDAYISELARCESGFNESAINQDDGAKGLHSYGILQIQPPTFYFYWKKLINPDIEKAEVMNLITDSDSQWTLTRKILEDNPRNWGNWYTCGLRIGLDKWGK